MLLIDLLTLDEPVSAPGGIVYSTQPRRAGGQDGNDYFVKGPDSEIVFAELAGCLLAGAVGDALGMPVAPVAVCRLNDERLAGSRKVADLARNVAPWLIPDKAVNFAALYHAIVVDAWLGNTDRNLGNVLGRAAGAGKVELVMIDYEKSAALRKNPLILSSMIVPANLWPTNELGEIARVRKPPRPPAAAVEQIRALAGNRRRIETIVGEVSEAVGPIDWSENSIEALVRRANRIEKIAGEVWAAA